MQLFILKNFQFSSDRVVDRGGDLNTNWFNTLLLDGQITPTDNQCERHFCEEVKHKLHSVLLPPNLQHERVIPLPMYYSHSTMVRPILQLDGAPITTPAELSLISGLPQCPPPGFTGPLEVRYIKSMPTCPTKIISVYNPHQRRRKTKSPAMVGRSCPIHHGGDDYNPQIFLTMGLRQDGTMDIRLIGNLLEKLRFLYGDNFTMRLEVRELKLAKMFQTSHVAGSEWEVTGLKGSTKRLEYLTSFTVEGIKFRSNCDPAHNFSCFGVDIPSMFAVGIQNAWNSGYFLISASISLQVSFARATDELMNDKGKINKTILNDEIEADVTIVARNGALIKCHRAFLAATSPVFAGMFRANMRESETGRIEMPNESEKAIRALLAYLYYWDLEDPSKDLGLALELLQIAHIYDFKDLEAAIKNLFLNRPHQYFSIDDALDLFCYTRKIPTYVDLRKKSVQVVKFHANSLDRSWKYKELFVLDMEAAKELCKFAFLT